MALLLGYDVGSSSVKATLMDAETGEVLGSATSPDKELDIIAKEIGWAEQHPETWWEHVVKATGSISVAAKFDPADVAAIGISYQMHGLVCVDRNKEVLRPSIIWCDSRAVAIGEQAAGDIGAEKCLKRLFNLPGNFTASKLAWVKEDEPEVYAKIHKMMLPGDYIAMKMTGEIKTTPSGLSEGIMWDFEADGLADFVLDNYGISPDLVADTVPTFSVQGELTKAAADELGLAAGTKISYRAGDQPNNALSLSVLEPGEIAVTAGTSGVVYGVGDKKNYDPKSRVNVFVHVNHAKGDPRYGVLLCLNGTGILNSWLKHNVGAEGLDYPEMNELAAQVPVGSDGGLGPRLELQRPQEGAPAPRRPGGNRLRAEPRARHNARYGHRAQDRQGRQRQHVSQPAVRRGLRDRYRRKRAALQYRRLAGRCKGRRHRRGNLQRPRRRLHRPGARQDNRAQSRPGRGLQGCLRRVGGSPRQAIVAPDPATSA